MKNQKVVTTGTVLDMYRNQKYISLILRVTIFDYYKVTKKVMVWANSTT